MVVKLGQDIKPSVQLRKLYYMYLFAGMAIFVLLFIVPFLAFGVYDALFVIAIFPGIPVLIGFVIALVWIPMYFKTISYRFNHSEMVWKRGVWFRKTGVVPYNRITNVDIDQGPVSRKLGIASIKVQTAGYSAPNARTSEIRIDGMTNFDEIRDVIITYVRGQKPIAVETYDKDEPADVVGELVKIRKLLEKRGRKG
ncbi:MAG: PH domain-containing protein [Candidatus Aenigmatarchaeota archaeon]